MLGPSCFAQEKSSAAASVRLIPPDLESRVVYYHDFSGPAAAVPRVNRIQAEVVLPAGELAPALDGNGWAFRDDEKRKGEPVIVRSPLLSPDRSLTLSVWWRLDVPMALPACFHILSLRGGRGLVSAFVRGKGEWCSLREPTQIFQVYYHHGIADVNARCGRIVAAANEWHHTALVFSNAANVRLYRDGRFVRRIAIRGRVFRATDGGRLDLGPTGLFHPMTIDEIMVCDRALSDDEIAAYVDTVMKLNQLPSRAVED